MALVAAVLGLGSTTAIVSASTDAPVQAQCSAPAWSSSAFYPQGSIVSHNGHEWSANMFIWPGLEPGVGNVPPWWVPWQDLGPCSPGGTTTTSQPGSTTTTTSGTASPPGQPTSGPGGSDHPHGDWIVNQVGSGNNAAFVFQPTSPRPASAPVAVMLHGFGETSGYDVMHNFIRHTVRKGYVVIYPRYQTGLFNPSPLDFETNLQTALAGLNGGLDWLQADSNRTQPQLDQVGYMGHSFGGIIAANMANRHQSLGIPVPKSLYLFEPHGGLAGNPLDSNMGGIPASTKVVCNISERYTATDQGCFSFFPKIGHIPNQNKDFVVTYSDNHGNPDLHADHFSICSPPAGSDCYPPDPTDPSRIPETERRTDALDFFAHWKAWVSLQSCANEGTLCEHALGNTPEHRRMGVWSDGTQVREQVIADAPISP
jgi:acetyl esterase/lipase